MSTEILVKRGNKTVCSLDQMQTYAERLRWGMERIEGMSQSGLARALKKQGVSITQQSIGYLLSPAASGSNHTTAIARELGLNPEWLATGRGERLASPPQPPGEKGASPIILDQDLSKARPINYPSNNTRDLPVLGTAMGGLNGYFEMQGTIIEHVWRPPHLATVTNAFALYVSGFSMSPRYEEGELIYCRPGRHPRPGNYVVLEMHQESDGAPIMATIGRYKRLAGNHYEIEKLNPPSVQKVPAGKVKRVHIIAGTGEP